MSNFFREVTDNETTVAVAPTATALTGWINVKLFNFVSGYIENLDVSQTVNGIVRSRHLNDSSFATHDWAGIDAIAPGERRPFELACSPYDEVRFYASASGAGCNVKVYVARWVGLPFRT